MPYARAGDVIPALLKSQSSAFGMTRSKGVFFVKNGETLYGMERTDVKEMQERNDILDAHIGIMTALLTKTV